MKQKFSLGTEAMTNTTGRGAGIFGLFALLCLVIYTASHAVNLVGHNANFDQSNPLAPVLYFGIAVVELMALVTAIQVMTHQFRAVQKIPVVVLELTWVIFAAINLIASFALDHNQILPPLIQGWVNYGLPVSALIVGIEYYVILRMNPDARRIDENKEADEMFEQIEHDAEVEVLSSAQMAVVIRQMKWYTMPDIIGQRLNLTQEQINHVKRHAPELFDGDGNGIGDIEEMGGRRPSLPTPSQPPVANGATPRRVATETPPLPTETRGDGATEEQYPPFE